MELERWRGKEGGKEKKTELYLKTKRLIRNVYYRHLGARNVLSVKMQNQISLLIIRYLTQHPSFLSRFIGLREATH